MGQARALLALRDPSVQLQLAEAAIRHGLTVRALEAKVKAMAAAATAPSATTSRASRQAAWLKEIEECLSQTLNTPTAVRYGRKTSVIQITCAGREEFERIYARLKDC
jgi:ParB family chromosome partitioning protein